MPSLETSLPPDLFSALEAHFIRTADFFAGLKTSMPDAVILGGGYGRAEGGVCLDSSGRSTLFNDLDYFIFTNTPGDPVLLAAVKEWEARESHLLGIDVEGKCLPESDVRQASQSMMFFDLVSGHRVVLGPEDFLAPYQSLADPRQIDPVEATRLLWNRGSGLYFALCDLHAGQNLDRVHRNQSKAKLALGDAWLTIRGQYRALAQERNQCLHAAVEVDPEILELHDIGLEFKLRPTPVPGLEELQATQRNLVALWLKHYLEVESIRLGHPFDSPVAYARFSGRLYPETAYLRNLLLALRDRLKRGGVLRPLGDYPRGALHRALVLLLSGDAEAMCPSIRNYLGAEGARPLDFSVAYQRWWALYS